MRAASAADVEELVTADPFRREGVVAGHTVTQWQPIIGRWAADLA